MKYLQGKFSTDYLRANKNVILMPNDNGTKAEHHTKFVIEVENITDKSTVLIFYINGRLIL